VVHPMYIQVRIKQMRSLAVYKGTKTAFVVTEALESWKVVIGNVKSKISCQRVASVIEIGELAAIRIRSR